VLGSCEQGYEPLGVSYKVVEFLADSVFICEERSQSGIVNPVIFNIKLSFHL
jgi:hypothetical protein